MSDNFYDDDYDDDYDIVDDCDIEHEIEVARIMSVVSHSVLMRAAVDNKAAMSDLTNIGVYINLLELKLAAIESCLEVQDF